MVDQPFTAFEAQDASARYLTVQPEPDEPRQYTFFDRELEQRLLDNNFSTVGGDHLFLVVIGPHKCGKTRVLRKVLLQNEVEVDFKPGSLAEVRSWLARKLLKRDTFELANKGVIVNKYRCIHIDLGGEELPDDNSFVVTMSRGMLSHCCGRQFIPHISLQSSNILLLVIARHFAA